MVPVMDMESIRSAVGQADAAVFRLINTGLGCRALDPVMLLATALGTGLFQTGASLFLILFGTIRDRVELRRAGYAGLIAFAAAGVLVQVAKMLWDRPRPLLAMWDVRVVGGPLFTHSFPSGHTMTAFAVLVAWSIVLPKTRWLMLGLAAATGFSRVYLGAHFPLDVIYGALTGALVGYGSAKMFTRKDETGRQAGEQEGRSA